MKTNTSRFCKEELAIAVGPESGEWATVTTDVLLEDSDTLKMFAVGHRRGPAVHTFISTCGETTLGKPQAHKDDDLDVDTMYVVARKCPKILNDATTAQPKIDRANKKRQFELAFERRFRTQSFPFRLFSSILGITICDAFYLHNYLNQTARLEWSDAVRRAFYAMINNNLDKIDEGTCEADELFQEPDAAAFSHSTKRRKRQRDDSGDEGADGNVHYCMPLSQLEGYDYARKKQQWCIVCRKSKVSYCCGTCSTTNEVFALHPKRNKHSSQCLSEHRRAPAAFPPVLIKSNKRTGATGMSATPTFAQRSSAARRIRGARRRHSRGEEEGFSSSVEESGEEGEDGDFVAPEHSEASESIGSSEDAL